MSITMMKVLKADLTPQLLKSVLTYDPVTGTLVWCSKFHNKGIVLGSRAGSLIPATGYRSITVFGKTYAEHILIWFMYYGVWPTGQIDHKDQIRDHNWIDNLRDITFKQNMRNKVALKDTVTGHQGVWYNKRRNRYVAEITMDGKKVYQKSFKTASEAVAERRLKLIEFGFMENHGSEK